MAKFKKQAAFEEWQEGTEPAVLVRIIDYGMQVSKFNPGKGPKQQYKFIFEVPGQTITIDKEEQPRHLWVNVTGATGGKATFPKIYRALTREKQIPDDVELSDLLGKSCLIEFAERFDDDDKSLGIGPVMYKATAKTVEAQASMYIFDFDNPADDVVMQLSKKVREAISKADNFSGSEAEEMFDSVPLPDEVEASSHKTTKRAAKPAVKTRPVKQAAAPDEDDEEEIEEEDVVQIKTKKPASKAAPIAKPKKLVAVSLKEEPDDEEEFLP